MFYLSEYFESHRDEYYDKLLGVSRDGNLEDWIEYFLNAIIKEAKKNIKKATLIYDLYNKKKEEIVNLTHSQYSIQTLDAIFSFPVFSSMTFYKKSKIDNRNGSRILKQLADGDILDVIEKGSDKKPTSYRFKDLLDIVNI